MELINVHCNKCEGTGRESYYDFDRVCLICEGRGIVKVTQEQQEQIDKERKRQIDEIRDLKSKDKGCFIATTCYENYDAPEVLVLRQFRDDKLLKTFFGKVFVNFYYSFSPFFATLISKSDWLKKLVRQYLLEPFVAKLQRQNNGLYRTN